MLLGGLWHGASWTFVLWGLFHGVGLAINTAWDKQLAKSPALSRVANSFSGLFFAHVITIITVLCGWVLFRAKTLPEAISFFSVMFTVKTASIDCEVAHAFFNSPVPAAVAVYLLVVLSGALVKQMEKSTTPSYSGAHAFPGLDLQAFAGPPAFLLKLPAMVNISASLFIGFVLLAFCRGEIQPFIYFQF